MGLLRRRRSHHQHHHHHHRTHFSWQRSNMRICASAIKFLQLHITWNRFVPFIFKSHPWGRTGMPYPRCWQGFSAVPVKLWTWAWRTTRHHPHLLDTQGQALLTWSSGRSSAANSGAKQSSVQYGQNPNICFLAVLLQPSPIPDCMEGFPILRPNLDTITSQNKGWWNPNKSCWSFKIVTSPFALRQSLFLDG